MPMHPQVQELVEKLAASDFAPIQSLTPDGARAQYLAMVNARAEEPLPMASVEDRHAPSPDHEIPVRIYRPEGLSAPAPCLVFYHGGGHVIGSLDTHDKICRNLCAGGGVVVVSVDYRMGPEHKFPAAVDDSWAALEWLAANGDELGVDPNKLTVAGDSAGGNLAGVVALMARDAGAPKLALQVLVLLRHRRLLEEIRQLKPPPCLHDETPVSSNTQTHLIYLDQ